MSVTMYLFYTVVVCVVLFCVIGILGMWDVVNDEFGWKALVTLAFIGGGAATIAIVQKILGVIL